MQTCLTVDKGSSPWSATVEVFGGDVDSEVVSVKLFGQYGSADGSLLPDDPTLIGNAEGHSHPTLPIALVFARTSYAATMSEPIEAATRCIRPRCDGRLLQLNVSDLAPSQLGHDAPDELVGLGALFHALRGYATVSRSVQKQLQLDVVENSGHSPRLGIARQRRRKRRRASPYFSGGGACPQRLH
jgi:hypothetical protein